MTRLACPYLQGDVELGAERERHIQERHPDLLPAHRDEVRQTVGDPDQVRGSVRAKNARLFSRWFGKIRGGKHVVVVVMTEPPQRHWVATAYLAAKLAEGAVEWKRS